MERPCRTAACVLAALLLTASAPALTTSWDTFADTWVATDGLGRSLPTHTQTGPPKRGKQVAAFYFLWLGEHGRGGPYDVSKILAQDPGAMEKPDSPLWGPMYAPHHWGESLFGYYLSDDAYVIRKHAQMLSDAGVDAVVFDVTNGFTYEKNALALCRVFEDVRRLGAKTPRISFLTPFHDPARVVRDLYKSLYGPGRYRDLWYRVDGKPLILADGDLMRYEQRIGGWSEPAELKPGHTLGQVFTSDGPLSGAGGSFATYLTRNAALTLTLRRGGPDGPVAATRRFTGLVDNAVQMLKLDAPEPAGTYYLEASAPAGRVAWWGRPDDAYAAGAAHADGQPVAGDRSIWLDHPNNPDRAILEAFTFRRPVASYFTGPSGPDQWGWLEVAPQHAFRNARGEVEEVAVGIAQNAVDGQLGVLSNPRAHGRSFHDGQEPPPALQDFSGRNVQEQWKRAFQLDPKTVFLTGWNEWVAGRFPSTAPFHGAGPVAFVDEFNAEFSRDAEPMVGGHQDAYYYQLVSYVRRFKGTRAIPPAGPRARVSIDGRFDDWTPVQPEFRDDIGDVPHRDHEAWNPAMPRYVNRTGRNDFVRVKVARDARTVAFMAETRAALSAAPDRLWMRLYLDTDQNPRTGWLGYDWCVRPSRTGLATLSRWTGRAWQGRTTIPCRAAGARLELAIPRSTLGYTRRPVRLDLKWTDNVDAERDVLNLYRDGDAAPNGRFSYRYSAPD